MIWAGNVYATQFSFSLCVCVCVGFSRPPTSLSVGLCVCMRAYVFILLRSVHAGNYYQIQYLIAPKNVMINMGILLQIFLQIWSFSIYFFHTCFCVLFTLTNLKLYFSTKINEICNCWSPDKLEPFIGYLVGSIKIY